MSSCSSLFPLEVCCIVIERLCSEKISGSPKSSKLMKSRVPSINFFKDSLVAWHPGGRGWSLLPILDCTVYYRGTLCCGLQVYFVARF